VRPTGFGLNTGIAAFGGGRTGGAIMVPLWRGWLDHWPRRVVGRDQGADGARARGWRRGWRYLAGRVGAAPVGPLGVGVRGRERQQGSCWTPIGLTAPHPRIWLEHRDCRDSRGRSRGTSRCLDARIWLGCWPLRPLVGPARGRRLLVPPTDLPMRRRGRQVDSGGGPVEDHPEK
jgi:hypothetical protein